MIHNDKNNDNDNDNDNNNGYDNKNDENDDIMTVITMTKNRAIKFLCLYVCYLLSYNI